MKLLKIILFSFLVITFSSCSSKEKSQEVLIENSKKNIAEVDPIDLEQNSIGEKELINRKKVQIVKKIPVRKATPEELEDIKRHRYSDISNKLKKSKCKIPNLILPNDFAVFATSNPYLGKKLDFQIDQSGSDATQMDVIVNYTKKPTVLILGAYNPMIWNISWTPDTHIIGVFLSGDDRQVITGLDTNVPRLISPYDRNGYVCDITYIEIEENNLTNLNYLSQWLFGKGVDSIFPVKHPKEGEVVIGYKIPSKTELITNKSITPELFYDKNAVLAGKKGLDDAVKKGFIRKVTDADFKTWRNLSIKTKTMNKEVKYGFIRPELLKNRSYVILKNFTIPNGLNGGDSVSFFLPKGVPYPKGRLYHSILYDLDVMTCKGVTCNSYLENTSSY